MKLDIYFLSLPFVFFSLLKIFSQAIFAIMPFISACSKKNICFEALRNPGANFVPRIFWSCAHILSLSLRFCIYKIVMSPETATWNTLNSVCKADSTVLGTLESSETWQLLFLMIYRAQIVLHDALGGEHNATKDNASHKKDPAMQHRRSLMSGLGMIERLS